MVKKNEAERAYEQAVKRRFPSQYRSDNQSAPAKSLPLRTVTFAANPDSVLDELQLAMSRNPQFDRRLQRETVGNRVLGLVRKRYSPWVLLGTVLLFPIGLLLLLTGRNSSEEVVRVELRQLQEAPRITVQGTVSAKAIQDLIAHLENQFPPARAQEDLLSVVPGPVHNSQDPTLTAELTKLVALRDSGALSEDEFAAAKACVLGVAEEASLTDLGAADRWNETSLGGWRREAQGD